MPNEIFSSDLDVAPQSAHHSKVKTKKISKHQNREEQSKSLPSSRRCKHSKPPLFVPWLAGIP